MGNESSHTDDPNVVRLEKDVVEKNLEKIRTLEKESLNNRAILVTKNNEISILTDKKNKLLEENYELKTEKLYLTKSKVEASNKCEELEKRNEALKSELAKYESLPALKQIQELYENLQVFRQEIKKAETEIVNDEQSMNFTEKISEKKTANGKLHNILEQKSLDLQQEKQLIEAEEQLIQAEKKLETIRLNARSFSDHKQSKLTFIREKIKGCMNEFDNISDSINQIEEQLKNYQKQLTDLRNKDDQLKEQEREENEKILTLLDMHHSIMWGIKKIMEPLESSFVYDNTSEIRESDCVFISPDGKRRYAIILYNLKESPYDQQKVVDIINSICSISAEEIEIQRLGAFDSNKVRPIKLFVPTFTCVKAILSNKGKLKSSNFQNIWIVPFNKKRTRGKPNNQTKNY